ncbi:MAG: hypothetical protein AB7E85_00160 [Pseudobdellovibrionaceae bacterium]
MKSNDNRVNSFSSKIILPLPPEDPITQAMEMDVYAQFMRHLRHLNHSRMEVKILNSIDYVAHMTGNSEAHVTKILVDLGLRAPRFALPASYLDFADAAMVRTAYALAPSQALRELEHHWEEIGDDRFAALRQQNWLRMDEDLFSRA